MVVQHVSCVTGHIQPAPPSESFRVTLELKSLQDEPRAGFLFFFVLTGKIH